MTKSGIIKIQRKAIKSIYISTYIPRRCGIATFTKDLTNAINLINPYALAEVMAMNKPEDNLEYPWEVKYKINQFELNTYLQAVDYINQSGANIIMLEHEFGIFGGHCGDYVIPFIESIKKPIITTFHTVVENPDSVCGQIIQRIARASKAVVVMMPESANRLAKYYHVPKRKIVIIPHGTPDLPYGAISEFKNKYKNRLVLGNINLISRNKGLEYTIQATAKIAKEIPNVLCLIVGQTHPEVIKKEGESYRNELISLARKLKISRNVLFINKYVSLDELVEWLKLIDYYVTPYLDPSQISSGALAYAVGAGKSCLSTPYLYAKEVLGEDRGTLIPFQDADAITNSILHLEKHPIIKKKKEKNTYEYGRLMTWSSVALQHLDLFQKIIDKTTVK